MLAFLRGRRKFRFEFDDLGITERHRFFGVVPELAVLVGRKGTPDNARLGEC